jgi:hypothetical protein
MLQVLAAIFVILSLSVASAETPEVAAQVALVAELQTRDNQLDAEIRILGGGRTGPAAAKGLANRVRVLEEKITNITRASTELAAGRDDFERLRQIVNDERVVTLADLALEGVKDVPWRGTKNLLELARNPAAKKSDDTFEYLGSYALRDINEWTIRDLVRADQAQLIDVLRLLNTLRDAANDDRRNLARLLKLRQQQSANSAALNRERARLAKMQQN